MLAYKDNSVNCCTLYSSTKKKKKKKKKCKGQDKVEKHGNLLPELVAVAVSFRYRMFSGGPARPVPDSLFFSDR